MSRLPSGEWHPEQDAAPTGGDAENAGNSVHARIVAIPRTMRNRVIRTSDKEAAAIMAATSSQAKVMFWSRSGTERIRLPVAAK
jgi:hypothetical protein